MQYDVLLMPNVKAQNPKECQNPKFKKRLLTLGHLDLIWHLDFVI
jgi:hypothetical protein